MANDCAASLSVCALRVGRLAADGSTPSGSNNLYVSDQLITLVANVVNDTGAEIVLKNGCGKLIATKKEPDRLKRLELTVTLSSPDPELAELLAGFGLITSGGSSIGASYPAINGDPAAGVCLEAWTQAWSGGSQVSTLPYWRFVFPKVQLGPGNKELADAALSTIFVGPASENSGVGNGPNNDFPTGASTMGRVMSYFRDATIPTTQCGYQSTPLQV